MLVMNFVDDCVAFVCLPLEYRQVLVLHEFH